MEVYLDNSATTRAFPEVAELMTRIMCEDYGNPSSLHMKGVQAEQYLRYAKETFARLLKVNEKEIFFTSTNAICFPPFFTFRPIILSSFE